MKSSLKENLLALIKQKGTITYGEMVDWVLHEGYKPSTAERRLRGLCAAKNEAGELQTPQIEPYWAKSRRHTDYISGWKVIWHNVKKPLPTEFPIKFPKYQETTPIFSQAAGEKFIVTQRREEKPNVTFYSSHSDGKERSIVQRLI